MEIKKRLKAEHCHDWPVLFSDRSVLPSVFWVYHWHRRWMDYKMGSRDGIDTFVKARELIDDYNNQCRKEEICGEEEIFAKISQTESGETIVVICNPFMKRVHQTIPQSAELVFIDATSNIDRNDTKLFHLVCPSMIGGLPLADILCTREDTDTVAYALEMLKTVLPSQAFYGRGCVVGPTLFMTDDSDVLRNSLSSNWPSSVLLLCPFHVLQALWTWLRDAKHNIDKQDRPVLLRLFRRVLYSE